jgi:small-conductance mechanosensitive channel
MDNISTRFSFVSESEYNKVFNENIDLKSKILQLYNNEELLKETINNNNLTINELMAENLFLKNKILLIEGTYNIILEENKQIKEENKQIKEENKQIKEENKQIKEENKQLKEELIIIKEENKQLKEENKQLKEELIIIKEENKQIKKDINYLLNKDYINRIIYACQDLNSKESLEKIFKIPCNKLINKLRNKRNDNCHYILSDDNENTTLCKEQILYNILINLDEYKREMLNNKINSILVDEIIKFLNSKSYNNINIDDYEDYIEWFNY